MKVSTVKKNLLKLNLPYTVISNYHTSIAFLKSGCFAGFFGSDNDNAIFYMEKIKNGKKIDLLQTNPSLDVFVQYLEELKE